MPRRGGFVRAVAQAKREAERKKYQQVLAVMKAQSQAAKAAEQARKAYKHPSAAEQKERDRLYTESRLAHVSPKRRTRTNDDMLKHTSYRCLTVGHVLDVQTLKQPLPNPVFTPGPLAIVEPPPLPQNYQPLMPTGL